MNSKVTNILLIIIAILLVLNLFKEEIKDTVYFADPVPTIEEPAVDIVSVIEREGRCYVIDEDLPFTGKISSSYANGKIKYSIDCISGILNGKVTGFSDQGAILLHGQFIENKLLNVKYDDKEAGDIFSLPESDSPLISLSYLEMIMIQLDSSEK